MLRLPRNSLVRSTRPTIQQTFPHTKRPTHTPLSHNLPLLRRHFSDHPESSAARIQRRLADRFIQGYNDLSIPSLLAPRAKECEHHVLPANLRRPVRGNAEYAAFFAPLVPHLKDFKVDLFSCLSSCSSWC